MKNTFFLSYFEFLSILHVYYNFVAHTLCLSAIYNKIAHKYQLCNTKIVVFHVELVEFVSLFFACMFQFCFFFFGNCILNRAQIKTQNMQNIKKTLKFHDLKSILKEKKKQNLFELRNKK